MNTDIEQYPKNLQKRILNVGGLEAYQRQLREQGAKGGRKSSYKRTPEQKAAQSERMKQLWQQRKQNQ